MEYSWFITGGFILIIVSALLHGILPTPPPKAVGIDLGTTFSCIAIYNNHNGSTQILRDYNGNKIIPSIVSFLDNGEILIGRHSKYSIDKNILLKMNINNTIFDIKRFIGRNMSEIKKDTQLSLYPFQIIEKNNKPFFKIIRKDEILEYSPEFITSLILSKLKEIAEYNIHDSIKQVVLAVPVEFNNEQIHATVEASKLAGLNPLRIIYEPTAAAMAYGLHKKKNIENVIVYDFGGGTLDVSLLKIQNNIFQVVSNTGNKHLGGEDFNHNIMEYYLKKIYNETIFLNEENIFLQLLRLEVEKAKIELSEKEETKLRIYLKENDFIEEKLTRKKFEELNEKLFIEAISPVKKVLELANMKPNQVDEIVLVGGSTRIPKIRQILSLFFGKELNVDIDPDEAVAHGTAIQAAILTDGKLISVAAIEK
jgi:heat shock protein 5